MPTGTGSPFAEQWRNRNTAGSRQMRFDMIGEAKDIEHRLTKPNHPRINGETLPRRGRGRADEPDDQDGGLGSCRRRSTGKDFGNDPRAEGLTGHAAGGTPRP